MASITSTLSDVHQSLFTAKAAKGLTFDQIAHQMGRSEIWVASIFYGQAKPEPKDIDQLSKTLDIPIDDLQLALGSHFFPERGLGPTVPTDALLYRLYEIIRIFGYPIKSVIHEKFGDGIMSAIDFHAEVDKVHENGNDRVKLTLNGKWLPYSKF